MAMAKTSLHFILKEIRSKCRCHENVSNLLIDQLVEAEAVLGKCPVLLARMPRGSGKFYLSKI